MLFWGLLFLSLKSTTEASAFKKDDRVRGVPPSEKQRLWNAGGRPSKSGAWFIDLIPEKGNPRGNFWSKKLCESSQGVLFNLGVEIEV